MFVKQWDGPGWLGGKPCWINNLSEGFAPAPSAVLHGAEALNPSSKKNLVFNLGFSTYMSTHHDHNKQYCGWEEDSCNPPVTVTKKLILTAQIFYVENIRNPSWWLAEVAFTFQKCSSGIFIQMFSVFFWHYINTSSPVLKNAQMCLFFFIFYDSPAFITCMIFYQRYLDPVLWEAIWTGREILHTDTKYCMQPPQMTDRTWTNG